MNIYQKIVLIGGLILLLGILLFYTPYNHIKSDGNRTMILGTSYSSIFTPPYAEYGDAFIKYPEGWDTNEIKSAVYKNQMAILHQYTFKANTVEIDYPKLILFIILIFITISILVIVLKSPKKEVL